MKNPFEYMRDKAISEQLKIALDRKLQRKYHQHINSIPNPEALKLRFLIEGKQGSSHEMVWPQHGFLNKTNANNIVKDMADLNLNAKFEISFIWFSELPKNEQHENRENRKTA